jgi:hypothetical protein
MHRCKKSGWLEPTFVAYNPILVCKPPNLKFHDGLIKNLKYSISDIHFNPEMPQKPKKRLQAVF